MNNVQIKINHVQSYESKHILMNEVINLNIGCVIM